MKQLIYDTRQQELVEFEPHVPGEVGMYVCGPTVQSAPHIGHLRSALVYDQLRRWLTAAGYRVTLIRNVTDIDDKILDNAEVQRAQGNDEPWWALAYRVERDFTRAYDALGVLPPTYEPRATANIGEMIALIELLIASGHAYPAADGSASVYFDTASWPEYGELTRQRRDQMEDAADSEPVGKRDSRDFALWKAHRDTEPESAAWPSPWGKGRPGWHIECSAMATRYLGEAFDIHGGGLDLRFPHHENELAQSRAAGHPFARYWLHNGLVNTQGQKMSKSLGNSLFAHDLLALARPVVLRYYLGSAHYRSVLDFSTEALAEADAAFSRIEALLARADEAVAGRPPVGNDASTHAHSSADWPHRPRAGTATIADLPAEFVAAMADDLGVPQALAVLHAQVRAGNTAFDAGDLEGGLAAAASVSAMLDVLGIDPRDAAWGSANDTTADTVLDSLVTGLLEERRAARERKEYAVGDAIRDRLQAAGITIEDGANGTRWSAS